MAVAMLIPLAFMVAWHSLNRAYPRVDAGDYFTKTQDSYVVYKDFGLLASVADTYLNRGKPILLPASGLPFLILARGDVRLAVAATMLFWYALFLFFLFRAVNQFCSLWKAELITAFIGTLPWVISSTHTFLSEISLAACSAAALYYFLKSDWGRSTRYSALFGAFLGLAICARPAEALLFFAVPAMAWLAQAYLHGAAKRWEIALAVSVTALGIGFCILFCNVDVRPPRYACIGAIALIPLGAKFLRLRRSKSAVAGNLGFSAAFALAFGLGLAWLAPWSKRLYDWIFAFSVSDIAKTGLESHGSPIVFVAGLFARLGGYPLLALAVCAAVALCVRVGGESIPRARTALTIALLGAALLPLCAGAFVYNPDTRYYHLSFLLMFVGLLCLALRDAGPLPRSRKALLALFALTGVFFYGRWNFTGEDLPKLFQTAPNTLSNVRPLTADPSRQIVDGLISVAARFPATPRKAIPPALWEDRHEKDLAFGVMPMPANPGLVDAADPWALALISREQGLSWRFEWPFCGVCELPKELDSFRNGLDFILVGPLGHLADEPGNSPNDQARARKRDEILSAWKNHSLKKIGMGAGRLISTEGGLTYLLVGLPLRGRR